MNTSNLRQHKAEFNLNSSHFVFCATAEHWSDYLKSDVTTISRSLTESTTFTVNDPWSCDTVRLSVVRNNKRFLLASPTYQAQSRTTLISLLRSNMSVNRIIFTLTLKTLGDFRAEARSLTNSRNKSGSNTDLCRTLLVTSSLAEHLFHILTSDSLLVRNVFTNQCT